MAQAIFRPERLNLAMVGPHSTEEERFHEALRF
jgi:hypothetical protein